MLNPRVLVIGAGATGASTAWRLRKAMGSKLHVEVWEKARGPGGRMSTNRYEGGSTTFYADMGAQYLSVNREKGSFEEVVNLLLASSTCTEVPQQILSSTPERPWGSAWRHLAGTSGGVNDALKALMEQASATVHYKKRARSLDIVQNKWRATPFEGPAASFDAVVVAVPGCGVGGDNLNKIHGNWENLLSDKQNQHLLSVEHDQRWSLALYLSAECAPSCDTYFGSDAFERVVDDDIVHLLSYQSRKMSRCSGSKASGSVVVVAHTTLPWAKNHARASGRDPRWQAEITDRVATILGLGKALSMRMLGSKLITWKQCEVTKAVPMDDPSIGPCMVVSKKPPLVLGGDYFTESTFLG